MQDSKNDIVLFLFVTTAIILLLVGFIITLLYFYQKKKIIYQRTLTTLELDHQKNLLATTLEIQESTFQHISREIHDNITLSLTLAKLQLDSVFEARNKKNLQAIKPSIDLIEKSIDDLSKLSKTLNSDLIKSQGLIVALRKEFDRIRSIGLFSISFQVKGSSVFMTAEKELIIFRIIQESFNNIIKHSNAKFVRVTLKYKCDSMILRVIDDGKGFDYASIQKNDGAGLNNIINRTEVLNGEIDIDSEPGKGTRIHITIPYTV